MEWIGKMEEILEANGGEFMVGGGLTWADMAVAVCLGRLADLVKVDWEHKSPNLASFRKKVCSLPNIKKWMDTKNNSM